LSHHKIEFVNVSYSYPNGIQAIKNVSLKITHSESVGIIGANGAGKSTLLLLLLGILKPDNGEIRIGDIKLTQKNIQIFRQKIGMVFQNPDDQLFMPTVYDDIAFGPRNYFMDENEIERFVDNAMKITNIEHLKNRIAYQLSPGEKRLVAIASVLSMNPDILLMDEPTSFLDPQARRKIINLINSFQHTKIITSHDLDLILETCERTIILNEGKLIVDDKTTNILNNKDLLISNKLDLPLSLSKCSACYYKLKFEK